MSLSKCPDDVHKKFVAIECIPINCLLNPPTARPDPELRPVPLRDLVPKSALSYILDTMKVFQLYSLSVDETAWIPSWVYVVPSFFFVLIGSFMLSCIGNDSLWSDIPSALPVLRYVRHFWLFGADQSSVTLSVVVSVSLVLYSLFVGINICFALFYWKHRRISIHWRRFSAVLQAVPLYIWPLVFPQQCAACLVQVVLGDTRFIGPFIVTLFFAVFSLVYIHVIFASSIIYIKGKTMTWDSQIPIFAALVIGAQSFFMTLAMGVAIPAVRIASLALCLILSVGAVISALPMSPGADGRTTVGFLLFQPPNFVVFVCKSLQATGAVRTLDSAVLLVCWPFVLAASALFLNWWHRWITARELAKFDLLSGDSSISPEGVFPSSRRFRLAVQRAFYRAHPYVLTWSPFLWAIRQWPRDLGVWTVFMRYLLIYPEAQKLLLKVYEQFADSECGYLMKGSFLFGARRYLNSRDKHESKELMRKFRQLNSRIERLKHSIVSYWASIANNKTSLTFMLVQAISERLTNIETEFCHLTVQYARNPYVCDRYAAFLSGIVSDPHLAALWRERAEILRVQDGHDVVSAQAFQALPLIPRVLPNQRLFSEVSGNPDDSSMPHAKVASGSSSVIDRDTGDDAEKEEIDDDVAQSRIREIALSVVIGPVRGLTWIVIIYNAVLIIVGSVIPLAIAFSNGADLTEYLETVRTACSIGRAVERATSFMLKDTLSMAHGFPTNAEEAIELGDLEPTRAFREQLDEAAIRLDLLIHEFQQMYGLGLAGSSLFHKLMSESAVWLTVLFDNGDLGLIENQYRTTFADSLSSLVQNFFVFTVPATTPINKRIWVLNTIINAKNVSEHVFVVVRSLCDEAVRRVEDHGAAHSLVMWILIAFVVLFIPLFIWGIRRVQTAWKGVLKALRSLPRVAIEGVMSRFGGLGNAGVVDSDTRLFNQMQSARDFRWWSELGAQVPLFIANVICPVVLVVLGYVLHFPVSADFQAISFRMLYNGLLSARMNRAVQVMNRRIAVSFGCQFYKDSNESLLMEARELKGLLAEAARLFLFGTSKSAQGAIDVHDAFLDRYDAAGWYNSPDRHQAFTSMPWTCLLNILQHIYSDFCSKAENPDWNFTEVDKNFLLFDYEFAQHFDTTLLDDILANMVVLKLQGTVWNFYATTCIVVILNALLALVIGSLTSADLVKIRASFRLMLAAAAMIHPRFVLGNPRVLSLLSGQADEGGLDNDNQYPLFEKAQDEAREAIFVLRRNGTILSHNKFAKSVFAFTGEIVRNVPIDRIVRFATDPGSTPVTTRATNVNSGAVLKVEAMFLEGVGDNKESILIIRDLTSLDAMAGEIQRLEAEIANLREFVLPPNIHQTHFQAHNCVVCVMEMCHFGEFIVAHSPEECRALVERFLTIIGDEVEQTQSASRLQQLGEAVFILFNLSGHGLQPLGLSAAIAVSFCRKVAAKLMTEGIICRAGMATDQSAPAGMVSRDRLLFDFYGNAMTLAYALARQAEDQYVIFQRNVPEFDDLKGIEPAQAQIDDEPMQQFPAIKMV
jgi:hypothetical protein